MITRALQQAIDHPHQIQSHSDHTPNISNFSVSLLVSWSGIARNSQRVFRCPLDDVVSKWRQSAMISLEHTSTSSIPQRSGFVI